MLADLQEMEVIFRKFSLISPSKVTQNCIHLVLRPLHSLHFHVPPGEVTKIQCRMYISSVGPPTSAFNIASISTSLQVRYWPLASTQPQFSFSTKGDAKDSVLMSSLRKITHNCLHLVLRPLHSLHFQVPPGEMSIFVHCLRRATHKCLQLVLRSLHSLHFHFSPSEMSDDQYL